MQNFELFLFDFDGLLVDTEHVHYQAYQLMLEQHRLDFSWDFNRYCLAAHYTPEHFRKLLYTSFPKLREFTWKDLYDEKQRIMQTLLKNETPNLMPGAKDLLEMLQTRSIAHCVVTHSPDSLVNLVKHKYSVLNNIPYWITRHDYTHPKPHPECYQLAISRYGKPNSTVIGFEDTPRGLSALMGTSAKCVLVSNIPYPEIPSLVSQGVTHVPSLKDVLKGI